MSERQRIKRDSNHLKLLKLKEAAVFRLIGDFEPSLQHDLLNLEQEQTLGLQVQAFLSLLKLHHPISCISTFEETEIYQDAVQSARKLYAHNQRLVERYAVFYGSRYQKDIDSLRKAGDLGLMKGIRGFDPNRGYHFATFSTWWIRREIVRDLLIQISKEKNSITLDETTEEILIRTGELTIQDESLEEIVEKSYLSDVVRKMLLAPQLNDNQRRVLLLRYGGEKVMTHAEIGKVFGTTRENIRRIEKEAIRNLRNTSIFSQIKEFAE